jgi:hypothetical protein
MLVKSLLKFIFELKLYFDSSPKIEERHFEALVLFIKVHDIRYIGLKRADCSFVFSVYFLSYDVHVFVIGAADRDSFGQDLKVSHRLHEL